MFITSILALDNSSHYLLINSSWLCGTFFSLMLDYLVSGLLLSVCLRALTGYIDCLSVMAL